jgi:two-component sensor histidine kinase
MEETSFFAKKQSMLRDKHKGKVKCWEVFQCNKKECPAYKSRNLNCWLFSGTHCRDEIQGKFIDKIEMCLNCEPFKMNLDVPSMKETCEVFNEQIKEYKQIVEDRDRELENISIELAIGLSEVFESLKSISSGDPLVRIPEISNIELIHKLKHLVNLTAQNIEEIVELSHEFAIGLAEHFDVLHKVSKGDFYARISDTSKEELLNALGKVTNEMIESVSREIEDRTQAEEHLITSLKEKEILLRELYHRTKNNMQVISSLLELQSITIDDKKTLQMFKDIQNRIRSIALVHEKLYQSKDLSNVNLKEYIADLIHALLISYEGRKRRVSLKADVDNIFLSLDTVTPCGMIISELVSNSLKYAFPDESKGEIIIGFHLTDDGEVNLRISDNGIGLPEGLDFRNAKSLGFKLICKLTEDQLKGTVELEDRKGTAFLVKFREIKRQGDIIE